MQADDQKIEDVAPGSSGLHFACVKCAGPINEPGALLFSPPRGEIVQKLHLCVECWSLLHHHFLGLGAMPHTPSTDTA